MSTTQQAKSSVGRHGENIAARFLLAQGLEIVDRNWRCAQGEIDIVARDGNTLVVCEVKTRQGAAFGTPLEAVTSAKAARLRRLAGQWLAEHSVRLPDVRVDVLGVSLPRRGRAVVDHVRGAV